ncbi:Hypothetical predicted protein [Lecanosticta acicola]|uniref:Carboxylic ester hydrolase n=1 Tax=Lecanosticta acicola TaxID=111012 RepID=A0AAI8Z778_9PEZI|nr:Hypothetical predicted protein [Lecanosticta acicola]
MPRFRASAAFSSLLLISTRHVAAQETLLNRCTKEVFSLPDVAGVEFVVFRAEPVLGYSTMTIPVVHIDGGVWSNLNFCNVTVAYIHPGRNDKVTVNVQLPLHDWNGRFHGSGGAGLAASLPSTAMPSNALAPALSQGYAAASTDAGHVQDPFNINWALDESGQVNIGLLETFASTSLYELALIGKHVVKKFYGRPPRFSYWNGCSTGGRQGMILAQRYPDAFDGIVAGTPSFNWAQLLVAEYWPQHVMNRLGDYPPPCEFDEINRLVIEEEDMVDGVRDGVISDPRRNGFNAKKLVGRPFMCQGQPWRISEAAAKIANAVWEGPREASGRQLWYGLLPGTPFFNASDPITPGIGGTICKGGTCTGAPFALALAWLQLLVFQDPKVDLTRLSNEQYFEALFTSYQKYDGIMGSANPDLTDFRGRGGKMISWHGLADQLIMPDGTADYYERVTEHHPDVENFYRHFEAPGVAHCRNGPGAIPKDVLGAVVQWVEDDIVPNMLTAISQTGDGTVRPLCPFPAQQQYVGGDPKDWHSFACVPPLERFGNIIV